MSTQKLTAFEQTIVAGLADQAGLAASILDTWSDLPIASVQSPRSLVDAAQLSLTDEGATEKLLVRAVSLGLISKEQSGFRACGNAKTLFPRLALALYSIEHYRSAVHRDATVAQVVLTKPPRPSVLEQKLSDLGWRVANLDPTEHAFHGMVQSALRRVVVMTPFLDNVGATWLRELLSYTSPGIDRTLILRSLEEPARKDYPVGFDLISRWLKEEGIRVFNYSIAKAGGGRVVPPQNPRDQK